SQSSCTHQRGRECGPGDAWGRGVRRTNGGGGIGRHGPPDALAASSTLRNCILCYEVKRGKKKELPVVDLCAFQPAEAAFTSLTDPSVRSAVAPPWQRTPRPPARPGPAATSGPPETPGRSRKYTGRTPRPAHRPRTPGHEC